MYEGKKAELVGFIHFPSLSHIYESPREKVSYQHFSSSHVWSSNVLPIESNINTVRLSPQNLLHSFSFCEFIHKFIKITSISIERIFYFLYFHTTNTSSDFRGIRIHRWRFSEKSFQSDGRIDLFLQPFFIISSEPENYLIDFISRASLFLCLCDIHRIDACKGHLVNAFEHFLIFLHRRFLGIWNICFYQFFEFFERLLPPKIAHLCGNHLKNPFLSCDNLRSTENWF